MAKAQTLQETFDTFSSTKWYRSNATNVSFTGGQLKLIPTTSYHYIQSATSYDLRGSYFEIQLVQNCNAGSNGSITTSFRVQIDGSNFFEFEIGGGSSGAVICRERVAGSDSTSSSTYNATDYAYLRLRESGGTIYWEVSPDRVTWTTRRSKASSLNLSSVTLSLLCGRYMSETTPGFALFDNLNPDGGIPKIATLTDDFSTADIGKWDGYSGGLAAVSDGMLRLAGGSSAYYPPLESLDLFDLTESNLAFQLVDNLPAGGGTYTTEVQIAVDGNNLVGFSIEGGTNGSVYMIEKVSGTASTTSISFNRFRHKWFRIRHASGSLYWETSIDGSTWVTRRSKSTSLTLTGVKVSFVSGNYGSEAAADAVIDNVGLSTGSTIGTDQPLPISLLTDAFDNLDQWYAPSGVAVSGGKLVITPTADYVFATTTDTWDITGDSLLWEVVQNANKGVYEYGSSITTEMQVRLDANNSFGFILDGGTTSKLTLRHRVAGVNSDTSAAYGADIRWLRLRESGGTIYWETSKNGVTWSIKRSASKAFSLSGVQPFIVSGYWDGETDPGTVVIDNVNLPNTALLKEIGWYVGQRMPFGGEGGATVQARNFFRQADWLWEPIPDDPVLDPMSSTWAGYLAEDAHPINMVDFGNTIILPSQITEETPRYHVNIVGHDLYPDWYAAGDDPTAGYLIPIPDGTEIPPGSDGHLCVMDREQGKVFSFWQAYKSDGQWYASYSGVSDFNGDGRDYVGGSTATELSRVSGAILTNEIVAGEIPHAIFFASAAAGTGFRYPAQKSDGKNLSGVDYPIPEGVRIQLDPTIDLATIPGITPGELAIGRALQRYGGYLGDTGGNPGEKGLGIGLQYIWGEGIDGTNPPAEYVQVGFPWDYFDLSHIPWSSLRVLKNWDGS